MELINNIKNEELEPGEIKNLIRTLFSEVQDLKKEKIGLKLLTVKEATEILRIKRSTLYNMVGNREIPFIKLNGKILFDFYDLKKYIERIKIKSYKK
jgi:excisionase family DNA binding protein